MGNGMINRAILEEAINRIEDVLTGLDVPLGRVEDHEDLSRNSIGTITDVQLDDRFGILLTADVEDYGDVHFYLYEINWDAVPSQVN